MGGAKRVHLGTDLCYTGGLGCNTMDMNVMSRQRVCMNVKVTITEGLT